MTIKKKKTVAISRLLIFSITIVAILLITMFLWFNKTTAERLIEMEKIAYTNALNGQVYMVENEFSRMENNLTGVVANDQTYAILMSLKEGATYNTYKYDLQRQMQEQLKGYSFIDGIFMLDMNNSQIISVNRGSVSSSIGQLVTSYAAQDFDEERLKAAGVRNYYLENIDGSYYLYYLFKSGSWYFGTWCRDTSLLPVNFEDYEDAGMKLILDTKEAQVMSGKANSIDVIVSGATSGLTYVLQLSSDRIRNTVFDFLKIDIMVFIMILLIVVFLLGLVVFEVIGPLKKIELELIRIGSGEEEQGIKPTGIVKEYLEFCHAFNEMLERLKAAKIQVYEEQTLRQQVQMDYLATQTNPHFFVNSLNVMHSLARIRNYRLVEEMAEYMSDYYGYLFKQDRKRVTLKQELSHIDNYLHIQKIRYAEMFECVINIENEELYRAKVPILMIHTFIENSVKYSDIEYESLMIFVNVSRSDERMHIEVGDNGSGYSEDVLKQLNSGEKIIKPDGEHIGIMNLVQRSKMYFKDDFKIEFKNRVEGGALTIIDCPFWEDQEA